LAILSAALSTSTGVDLRFLHNSRRAGTQKILRPPPQLLRVSPHHARGTARQLPQIAFP